MTYKVDAYKCDFCSKIYSRNYSAKKHEIICFKNPNRTPKHMELAVFKTMPNALKMVNSYGVHGSDWMEPKNKCFDVSNEFETTYKWWPKDSDGELAIGFYWDNKWKPIPGYKPPEFSPGLCWRDEVIPGDF